MSQEIMLHIESDNHPNFSITVEDNITGGELRQRIIRQINRTKLYLYLNGNEIDYELPLNEQSIVDGTTLYMGFRIV